TKFCLFCFKRNNISTIPSHVRAQFLTHFRVRKYTITNDLLINERILYYFLPFHSIPKTAKINNIIHSFHFLLETCKLLYKKTKNEKLKEKNYLESNMFVLLTNLFKNI
ncbi:hypothetical protein EGW08_009670, partial [Elysia chlorotica]